jgi:ribA/ribD-fused uncharacterized protein
MAALELECCKACGIYKPFPGHEYCCKTCFQSKGIKHGNSAHTLCSPTCCKACGIYKPFSGHEYCCRTCAQSNGRKHGNSEHIVCGLKPPDNLQCKLIACNCCIICNKYEAAAGYSTCCRECALSGGEMHSCKKIECHCCKMCGIYKVFPGYDYCCNSCIVSKAVNHDFVKKKGFNNCCETCGIYKKHMIKPGQYLNSCCFACEETGNVKHTCARILCKPEEEEEKEVKRKLPAILEVPRPSVGNKILFYESNKPYYEFANLYRKKADLFIDDKGESWKSSEHYFQAYKFILSGHPDLANQIKAIENAKAVFNFAQANTKAVDFSEWNKERDNVMLRALAFKFYQNKDLKDLLIGTKNAEIIEDSPYDSYWGIGIDKKTGNIGQNKLGKALMLLRANINAGVTLEDFLEAINNNKIAYGGSINYLQKYFKYLKKNNKL